MTPVHCCKHVCFLFLVCAAMAISSPAQTFTTLLTFDITNGTYPYGPLVQGLDGNFYATTANGGKQKCEGGCGTVFKITPDGTLTTLHSFVGTDGGYPLAGLLLATDGNLYGSTYGSSPESSGTTQSSGFAVMPNGTVTIGGGTVSAAPLMEANNGNFYGTTSIGGAYSHGTVFGPGLLHSFCALKNCADGSTPEAPLVQGPGGLLYGTTLYGGKSAPDLCGNSCGTIFKTGFGGSTSILYNFCLSANCPDGGNPSAGLIMGNDGNLYGTTLFGGAYNAGTVFKITPAGSLTTLHSFDHTDGAYPNATLVLGSDGNFYGTTVFGGTTASTKICGNDGGCGTVFKITPEGTLTSLHSFDRFDDGAFPYPGLVQGTDGNFYGETTGNVGLGVYGTVFKLSMGLTPFVKTLPTDANVGKPVIILGTDLTGATAVTFNGTAATFIVVSATEITTTVPKGATTGTVQVTTPSGTLSSNVAFVVP